VGHGLASAGSYFDRRAIAITRLVIVGPQVPGLATRVVIHGNGASAASLQTERIGSDWRPIPRAGYRFESHQAKAPNGSRY
jgi:hypothetical protein